VAYVAKDKNTVRPVSNQIALYSHPAKDGNHGLEVPWKARRAPYSGRWTHRGRKRPKGYAARRN